MRLGLAVAGSWLKKGALLFLLHYHKLGSAAGVPEPNPCFVFRHPRLQSAQKSVGGVKSETAPSIHTHQNRPNPIHIPSWSSFTQNNIVITRTFPPPVSQPKQSTTAAPTNKHTGAAIAAVHSARPPTKPVRTHTHRPSNYYPSKQSATLRPLTTRVPATGIRSTHFRYARGSVLSASPSESEASSSCDMVGWSWVDHRLE